MGLDKGDSFSNEWVPAINSRIKMSGTESCENPAYYRDNDEYRECETYTANVDPPKSWEVWKV